MYFHIITGLALIYCTGCGDAPQSPLISYAQNKYKPHAQHIRENNIVPAASGKVDSIRAARDDAEILHNALFSRVTEASQYSLLNGSKRAWCIFTSSNGWYRVDARLNKKNEKALAIYTHRGLLRNQSFSYDGFPKKLDGILDVSTNDFFLGITIDTPSTEEYHHDLHMLREFIEQRYAHKESKKE